MRFNSAFKGLKLLKNPGNGRLNNLNDPVLNVLKQAGSAKCIETVGYECAEVGHVNRMDVKRNVESNI